MATSPLFGWVEPDDTSLVKDGAAAIRTLGNSIDASMGDLLGGTTGQILAKQSNTNMDFHWVSANPGDITAVTAGTGISGGGTSGDVTITNSMATTITTKGDLIVGTGSATFNRLAAAENGSTLVADSSTSTGLRYTAGTVQANPVLNSAMQIWQRGTSFSLAASTSYLNGFVADRWQATTNANQASTVSRQLTGDTTNLPNIQYNLRFQRNSGQTGTGEYAMLQNFETINSIPFAGKTVTYSFYARAGANYSPASSALFARLWTGTGTDQTVYGGFTGQVNAVNTAATLTTTWQRFTFTATLGSNVTQIGLGWTWTPTGTAGAADYFDITGVQLDIGSVALPFRTNGATIQGELSACQRYLPSIQVSSSDIAIGQAYAATASLISIPFPVTARVAPTGVTVNSAGNFRLRNATSSLLTCTSLLFSTASTQSASLDGNVASGLVAGNATNLYNAGSGTILFTGCEL